VPLEWVCAALGLDADALAAAVRRIAGEAGGACSDDDDAMNGFVGAVEIKGSNDPLKKRQQNRGAH
jgi:hypothetical protein